MDERAQDRRRKIHWRRRLAAVAWAAGLHLLLFVVIAGDWARHRAPPPPQIVDITLERPDRPTPKPKVETPAPPPPAAASVPPSLRPSAPVTAPPAAAVAPLIVPPSRGPAGPLVGPEQAVNVGCLAKNLKGKAKEDCERHTVQALGDRGSKDERAYAALVPGPKPIANKATEPGLHMKGGGAMGLPGLSFVYIYGPNDKHFLPFQGDTKTTVFEPVEVKKSDLPVAMR